MPIYASKWTGAGTEADPRRPVALVAPTDVFRGVASLPDFIFINYGPPTGPAQLPAKADVLLLAPDLDTPIGDDAAYALGKNPFFFSASGTETCRMIAHRIGVYPEGA